MISGDRTSIEELLDTRNANSGVHGADVLRRVLDAGASPQDVATLIHIMQSRLLFSICCLLDDPGELENDVSCIGWGLFETDNQGDPIAPMRGLHESVLELEPPGRE